MDFIYIFAQKNLLKILVLTALTFSIVSIAYYFSKGQILIYGDAESHLNIAKRVVSSLTPGLAQLGGIWLPLPHLLMIPFVFFNPLWRSGLAGSIVSGIMYIVSAICIYKITYLLTKNVPASIIAFFVFCLNPNILYMQSTPLSEIPLIGFFLLSTYFFIVYVLEEKLSAIILAAVFGFCATLSRYDGWFLVAVEAFSLFLFYIPRLKTNYRKAEGIIILFATLAFFGIVLWLAWDGLILHDPFYFTNSPFSAKSQQEGWLARNELPAYKNLFMSFLYYSITSVRNSGIVSAILALAGFIIFFFSKKIWKRMIIALIFSVPFIFYVVTQYLGQSVIFIPDLTPQTYMWRLFNVRYGIMMVPFAAFFTGYFFYKIPKALKTLVVALLLLQCVSFSLHSEKIITLEDGLYGLSAMKTPDAQSWMAHHYDHGLVLLDDYARTLSIIKSNLPINKVIYIGNKPYWEESLKAPEKYATWVIAQKGDAIWNGIYENPAARGRLFKYFQKVYTSPEIIIFKRDSTA